MRFERSGPRPKPNHPSTSSLRAVASSVALLALSCLVGLFITEITLRLFDIKPQPILSKRELRPVSEKRRRIAKYYHCFPTDPHGDFLPAPDVTEGSWQLHDIMLTPQQLPLSKLAETPWCVEYVYWNGIVKLRDWKPSLRTRRGLKPIVLIGDSFVRGVGVPKEKTLSSQLERLLDTPKLSVINAGLPGADLSEQLQTLRNAIEKLRPSLALVVFIANDIYLGDELRQRQTYINDLILLRDQYLADHQSGAWYTGNLRMVQIIGSFLEMRKITKKTLGWYLDSYESRYNAEGLERLAADLATLAKIPECPVGLVLYPLLVNFEHGYPLASVHATVAQLALDAGLPVLDLAPVFAGMNTESLWVHPTDHHPNGEAHAIAARAVADWLRNDFPHLLPPSTLQGQKPGENRLAPTP